MLRKTKSGKIYGIDMPMPDVNAGAGMPVASDYMPQNVYKQIGSGSVPSLDVTDPFARMNPNKIPVPGTSVWTNPEGVGKMGNAFDMVGMFSSFDSRQRNTINPLVIYACQNEGPSALHREVQPLYEGCRRLILNGKQDIGYCQYENKIINFGRLFLDRDRYEFPFAFRGYKKNEISVFLVKYRSPNIVCQFEPIKEFNDEAFAIGQLCRESSIIMNYFWIAWAYMKNKDQIINDITSCQA